MRVFGDSIKCGGENGIEIDNRDSVGGEQEVAEGKRGNQGWGGKSKTYRKQEMEDHLLIITCLLICLIETIYSVLWMEKKKEMEKLFVDNTYVDVLD